MEITLPTSAGFDMPWWINGGAPPPDACSPAREPSFADWPGGARMSLTVSAFSDASAPLAIEITGADPGETVEVLAGSLCGLDCPQPDGGCLQAAGASSIGTFVASAAGTVSGLTLPVDFLGEWVVLQATAPHASVRYVSQPVVDHFGPYPGSPMPVQEVWEVGPATVRGFIPEYDLWRFPVAAGRRSEVTFASDTCGYVPVESGGVTVDGATSAVEVPKSGGATFSDEFSTPSAWNFTTTPSGWCVSDDALIVHFGLRPLLVEVPWFEDGDGDGYGDPGRFLGTSKEPVPGGSADGSDCDDGDAGVHPGGLETCGDGADQDCDGADRPCEGLGMVGTSGTHVRGAANLGVGHAVGAADLDGDGVDELLVGRGPAIGWVQGAGGYVTLDRADVTLDAVTPWRSSFYAAGFGGDLDQDGAAELFVVWDRTGLAVYADTNDAIADHELAAGPLLNDSGDVESSVQSINGVYTADVTGDGVPELLVSASFAIGTPAWTALTVFGDPLGAVTPLEVVAVASGVSIPGPGRAADFDGDGIGDWIDPNGCPWQGPVPFAEPPWCAPVDRATGGDVDGDGALDVVGADGENLLVFLRGAASPWATIALGVEATGLAWLVDADAHGRPWVHAEESTGVADYVHPIRGPGSWEFEGGLVWTGAELAAGDFDGDGALDLALGRPLVSHGTERSAGEVWVLWSAFDLAP